MNEKQIVLGWPVMNPNDSAAVGDLALYFWLPFTATLVYVSATPWEDDADATMDLHDDGTAIISALTCADKDVPGEWAAVGYGGANAPIAIAAGSKMSLDINAAANANRFDVKFHFLVGEGWG